MDLTARFCHLEYKPAYEVGDTIKRGQVIGKMGDTGQAYGKHLHLDINKGLHPEVYRLSQIHFEKHELVDILLQYHYFIDEELFGVDPVITTSFGDPNYIINKKWKYHPAFDLVPINRHDTQSNFLIYWNRSMDGKVLSAGYDGGYGYNINIGFTT